MDGLNPPVNHMCLLRQVKEQTQLKQAAKRNPGMGCNGTKTDEPHVLIVLL